MIATSTYTETAIHICVFTAFFQVPKNDLMRRCCLNRLKNNSTCQRHWYLLNLITLISQAWLNKKKEYDMPNASLRKMKKELYMNRPGNSGDH